MAAEGAKVVLADVLDCNSAAAEIAATYKRSEVLSLLTDVSDEKSTEGMVADTLECFGRLDILVNNAAIFGTLVPGSSEDIEVAEWDKLMAVNVKGVFFGCKRAVRQMLTQEV